MGKAVVTGGAGFIGSHLVDRLLGDGARVLVIDDLSTGSAANVPEDADLQTIDIVDGAAVEGAVTAFEPDAIFHLAAQASVTASVTDPRRDEEVNVRGTLNIAEAARLAEAPVVFASTGGALYGDSAPIPTSEAQPPVPVSPYGASKLAGEAYLRAWSASYGIPHTICRLGNAYGPRQRPHGEAGVVAIFSHKLWSGERPTLYGEGKPTRDYVYVTDITDAMLRACGTGGTFNIAAGTEVSVTRVFELLREIAGSEVEPILAPLRAGELERSGLDASLAADQLGWSPATTLEEGLGLTYRALTEEFAAAGA